MWKALTSISNLNQKNINDSFKEYYSIYQEEFNYIQHQLSRSVAQNIIIPLFEEEVNVMVEKNHKYGITSESLQLEQQCLKRLLLNKIAEVLKNERGEIKKDLTNDIENLKDKLIDFPDALDRMEILKIIDEQNIWKINAVEFITSYLRDSIEVWIKTWIDSLCNNMEIGLEVINVEGIQNSWIRFFGSFDGVSKTRVKETKRNISKILKSKTKKFNYKLDFCQYIQIVLELNKFLRNKKVWYGKYEAQELLNDLQDIVICINGDGEEIEEQYNAFLLRCYMKYKIVLQDSENIHQYATLLKQITETLSNAHKDVNEEIFYNFVDTLNKKLPYEVDKYKLEELFLEKEGM